ncbi:lipopolysaccharide biosynthesis protein [Mangrovibacterium sp.]|uniref:lipopolysaccharide biosynthesis protein n=1 Tax=Mangrovibacterium sp. TaxID=1961364 RepID=UPI003567D2B4
MTNSNNKRIAKNTLMLYFRQVLILLVSLYTIRIVLDVLGVEDYGIYNVVGGVVMLFSFLSGTMASASQRFFSFALGENNTEKLYKIFSVNLIIYLTIAIVALVLLESIGMWYVKEQLKIPAARYDAVIFLFHFSIFSFLATMLATPFMAMIIAHEDMHIYAYVSIIEVLMKLAVVYLLMSISYDKLELYGVLLFAVSILNLLLYVIICLTKYQECQFRKYYWDNALFKQILGFTGWTLFGQVTTVTRNQAVTILLNQSFSPIVVAARAVAINISTRINMFSANFNVGLYPPIIKSYSSGDNKGLFRLIFNGSKMTFFLMWVFALPIFIEMEMILGLWLKEVPEYAILFTRLSLVESLILSISLPLATAARAPGKMKVYELTLGIMQLLIFGIAWIVLNLGYPAYSVFVIAIVVNLLMFAVRLIIVSNLVGLSVILYLQQVALPVLLVIVLSASVSYYFHLLLERGIFSSILSTAFCMTISTAAMYLIGLNKEWRLKVNSFVRTKVVKLLPTA